jgi:hypothetical protein
MVTAGAGKGCEYLAAHHCEECAPAPHAAYYTLDGPVDVAGRDLLELDLRRQQRGKTGAIVLIEPLHPCVQQLHGSVFISHPLHQLSPNQHIPA